MEHTNHSINKKKKKFVKKFRKPGKKITTTTHHSRYESKYISSKRLTRKIGIYNKGKISELVSRRYEWSSPQVKARVQEDLHKILSQCEPEKTMSDTNEIVPMPCSTEVQEVKISTPFPRRKKAKPRKVIVSSNSSSSSEDTKDHTKRPKKPVLNTLKIFTSKVIEKPVKQKYQKRKRAITISPCYNPPIKKRYQERISSTSSSSPPMSSPIGMPVKNVHGKKNKNISFQQHLLSSGSFDGKTVEGIPPKNFHDENRVQVPDSSVVGHYIKSWSSLLEKKLRHIPSELPVKVISQEQTGENRKVVGQRLDSCCQTSDHNSSSLLQFISDSEDIESGKSSELTSSCDLRISSSLKSRDLFSPSLFNNFNINSNGAVHSSDRLLNDSALEPKRFEKLEDVQDDDFFLTVNIAGPSTLNLSSESSDVLFNSSPLKPPSGKLNSPRRFFRHKLY